MVGELGTDVVIKHRLKGIGRTAYADIAGHKVKHVVAGLGESV